jgi:hypothetical protein
MEQGRQTRRRIDRVTATDFLDGIGERSPAELRRLRDDCREEETRLSYTRRLLQGRLDIARAEIQRRASGGGDLLSALPAILADAPTQRRDAHVAPVYAPSGSDSRRSGDALLDDASLGRLPDLDDEELATLVGRLGEEERNVSRLRRTVLDHLDRLQAELIRRYQSGDVAVDEIVSAAVQSSASEEPTLSD